MKLSDRYSDESTHFGWVSLFKAIITLSGNNRRYLLVYSALLILVGSYGIIPPLLIGNMIDVLTRSSVFNQSTIQLFYVYASILGVSYMLVSILRLSIKKQIGDYIAKILYSIRVGGFEKILDHSMRWQEKENTGNKVQRIQAGAISLNRFIRLFNNEISGTITSTLGITLIFVFLKVTYVAFFLIYLVGFYFILKYFYGKMDSLNVEFYKSQEAASGTFVESAGNILTIKSLGAGEQFRRRVAERERLNKSHNDALRAISTHMWILFQVFSGLCFGVFLLLVGNDVLHHVITAGSFAIFYGYLNQLTNTSGDLLFVYTEILDTKAGIARMMPIFEEKSSIHFGSNVFPKNWNSITIDNVSFQYKKEQDQVERKEALQHVSLNILRGSKVGIVGQTGCGKSTLAKLLIGMYQIEQGEYFIGNENFYNLTYEQITDHVAIVLQDSEMFNLTVAENITLMKEVDTELLKKAIEIAQLTELIEKLPEGLETLIGEKGYHLSGGERQRIGIARAIVKNPEVIIFDEATSSLDSKTESAVQERIEKELKDKTIISIAHRVTTLKNVDVIYVFADGKIVEQGTYHELSKNTTSLFTSLYASQLIQFI